MKSLLRLATLALFVLSGLFLQHCSSESNSWTAKTYHNTTAHYNGYFYSREELAKIEQTIWGSMTDDYNRVLRLYPALDSAVAKGYDKEIQEAVKMSSLAIQRHPNSKWADDAYILVGRARLYSLDWGNAIQTFKYVNTKSKDPNARHEAIINLIRTFTEHKEFANGQAAIDFLEKEKLNKTNHKNFLLEKAYFYQTQNDLDKMVRNLTNAAPLLKKKDRPGRIYFIIGQIYQKLGFEAEAYGYYKRCISTNPEYEVDFYARLYMAQVTEISRSKDVNAARKSFKSLLKDSKNKEFKDKIYYEMGVFELKQKNLNEAITDLNHAVRTGSNKRIDGEAYLRLGEIYYDTLRQYKLSQAYYDSAIGALPKDYEGYAQIKARQEILNEFVKHLQTIEWQDSLLALAKMDSAAIYARLDSIYQKKKQEEEKLARRKKANRIDIESNTNSPFSTTEGNSNEGATWYFGNPPAMAIGQNEFRRVWGDVPLEDNWRRSQRSAVGGVQQLPQENNAANQNKEQPKETETVDPVAVEYAKLDKEIPRTEEQRKVALKKIEDAYFNLGDIYYFKLQEKDNAVSSYTTLLRRFPGNEHEPEVLYKLYLIYKDTDPTKADFFASKLKEQYPNSTFTKILLNPNYLAESSQAVEKQKVIYKTAYEYFQNKDYVLALQAIGEAEAMGETSFTPNLELLKVLIAGETENIAQFQFQLDQFIKKYPEEKITDYAKKLLATSRDFQNTQEKQKGIQYIKSLEEPHYFVLIYRKEENLSNVGTAALEKFNRQNFNELQLKTSNLQLNDEYSMILVVDLQQITQALSYMQTFNENMPRLTELQNHKFNTFVITKDNFDIFYRTKGLDEYLKFFEKNYPAEIQ